jgi:Rad3-related DNA helicase
MDAIEAAGGKPFFDYQVPSAVITLKQASAASSAPWRIGEF